VRRQRRLKRTDVIIAITEINPLLLGSLEAIEVKSKTTELIRKKRLMRS
jgi:hypothetical protein